MRFRAPAVTPARMKSRPEKEDWLQRRKERIMETVLPERMAPSARKIRQSAAGEPGRHQCRA